MRRVLAESDLPVVRAAMIQALGAHYDFASMPQLLPALDDEDCAGPVPVGVQVQLARLAERARR